MQVKLTVTHPLNMSGSILFDSRAEVEAFLSKLGHLGGGLFHLGYHVEDVVPPLYSWAPDDADKMVIVSLLGRGDKVGPIKFARMKSGSGLKEAKDWIEQYFGQNYQPQPRY